jgi:hypothetical protein
MKYEGESILEESLAYGVIIRTSPENARELIHFIKTLPETKVIKDRISTDDLFLVTKQELIEGWVCKSKGWKKTELEE